jgi:hypothetical protein
MASGHVNRENKAEHMAAPHRNLQRDDSPCQFGAVHTWPCSRMGRRGIPQQPRPEAPCVEIEIAYPAAHAGLTQASRALTTLTALPGSCNSGAGKAPFRFFDGGGVAAGSHPIKS